MKFTVSPAAVEQIKKTQPKVNSALRISRISVKGGGCSGFQYALQWVEGPLIPGDGVFFIDKNFETRIVFDPISAIYIDGTELDYVTDLNNSGFVFKATHAQEGLGAHRVIQRNCVVRFPRGAAQWNVRTKPRGL
jgi:iron-sulfur cluster assembly protein